MGEMYLSQYMTYALICVVILICMYSLLNMMYILIKCVLSCVMHMYENLKDIVLHVYITTNVILLCVSYVN